MQSNRKFLRVSKEIKPNPFRDKRCTYGVRGSDTIKVGTRLCLVDTSIEVGEPPVRKHSRQIDFVADTVHVREFPYDDDGRVTDKPSKLFTFLMENSEPENPVYQLFQDEGYECMSGKRFAIRAVKMGLLTLSQVKAILKEQSKEDEKD